MLYHQLCFEQCITTEMPTIDCKVQRLWFVLWRKCQARKLTSLLNSVMSLSNTLSA